MAPKAFDGMGDGPADASSQPASMTGKLKELKELESELQRKLAAVRLEKQSTLQSRPLTIGVVGFGRFGQFIAKTFAKYGRVVVTSRSDYTKHANAMGAKYIPLSDPARFFEEDLDVVVLAVSILSFEKTLLNMLPHLEAYLEGQGEEFSLDGEFETIMTTSSSLNGSTNGATTTTATTKAGTGIARTLTPRIRRGPLLVDMLSVKEHARDTMLRYLPKQCDILCTHPMFGPDSGKNGWGGLPFVYEVTRVNQKVLPLHSQQTEDIMSEGTDRVERFLSIWEEEGCQMIPMSCERHDAYAADSQFLTHLMGRILGAQDLLPTPIDTKGFQSMLGLVDSTTADSFDLFYGLYKYNKNSKQTVLKLQMALNGVLGSLLEKDIQQRALEDKEGVGKKLENATKVSSQS